MKEVKQLILASGSPFRAALLRGAGLQFVALTAPVDEDAIQGLAPPALALARARLKGTAVAKQYPDALVIGADQVLSCAGQSIDKATSAAEARQVLNHLSGKTHYLHSAVCLLAGDDAAEWGSFVVDVGMTMRMLTSIEIDAYVETGEWQGCVGCYQYENRGIHLFEGDGAEHSAVLGLPLLPLLKALRELGVDCLSRPAPPWVLSQRRPAPFSG